jgi:PleD family two-component response regulator
LSDHPVETSAGPLLVTMSMGVHQTENWGEHTVEELLHQLDSAMYAAKAAGRNRISFTELTVRSWPGGTGGSNTIVVMS